MFRNFDFVVCQTDELKEIQKIFQSAYFVRFLPYIYFSLRYYLNEISTVEKKRFFSKMKVMLPPGIIP